MSRVRAADDFEAIRLRMEELRRERARPQGGAEPLSQPSVREPDAAAHCPPGMVRRLLAGARRASHR